MTSLKSVVLVVLPVLRSHSLRVLSQDPDRAKCPSEEEHHIGDEVTKEKADQDDATRVKISSPVSVKSLLRNSRVSNIVPGQLPDNERLVSAGGHIC